MKQCKRLLAIMLCLFLAIGPMNFTLADDDPPSEPVAGESVNAPDPIPKPTAEPTAVPTPEPTAVPTAEPTAEPSIEPEESDAPEDELPETPVTASLEEDAPQVGPEIDYTRSAAYSPDFKLGYAELMNESTCYDAAASDAEALYTLKTGVVYVLDRSSSPAPDRLKAAFDDDGERVVWIDAGALRPLSPEETKAFVEARAAVKDVRYLSSDRNIPLSAPVFVSLANDEADAPVAEVPAMSVSPAACKLGVGETCDIAATFADGSDQPITYTSADTKIATVSANGTITGKKAGSTVITLSTESGAEATVEVTVQAAPSKITLSAARKTLGVGEELPLTAALPANTASQIYFTSSDDSVVAVDGAGNAIALSIGSATITAKTFNGKKASVTLTIKAAPEEITLSAPVSVLGIDQTAQLTATLTGDSGDCAGSYEFSADREDILWVDPATGAVKALSEGTAIVTVETYNHLIAVFTFTVVPAPSEVAFAQSAITIGIKESTTPAVIISTQTEEAQEDCAAGYTFKTSNKKVATVDANGTVKGVAAGSAIITVTTHNGLSATTKVTVKKTPTKVALSAARTTLGVNEVMPLTVSFSSGASSYLRTFSSDNEQVLTVDAGGSVTAVSPGEATVSVTIFNGLVGTLAFTVCPEPESITPNDPELVLGVGQSYVLGATLNEGSAGAFSFSTQDTDYLKVDATTGTITALAETAEDATVTVTAYNGVSGDCTVKVVPAPSKVAFAQSSMSIGLKESTKLPPVILGVQTEDVQENCAGSYTFKTSNKKIVTVDANGNIKGVATGSATITVTTHNKKTAKIKVSVKKKPTKVTLSASRTTLGLNEKMPLTVKYPSGTYSDIRSFASDNEEILTVDESGVVTAVGLGEATISVTTYNDKVGKLTFNVLPAPESIDPNDKELTLGVGQTYTLGATVNEGSAGGFIFSTEDTDVLKVNPNGTITALAETAEDATVTVTTYNDVSGDCTVKVVPAPSKVAFAQSSMSIGLKESTKLPPVILGVQTEDVQENCAGSYTFKTSNKKIVTVDANGNIKGVATGSATITVTTHNKKTAKIKVSVKKKPTKVTLSASRTTLGLNEEMPLTVKYPSGTYSDIRSFASDNEEILTVDEKGSVTAVGIGEATISVTTYNDKVGKLTFNVLPAPESIEPNDSYLVLGVGQSYVLGATLNEGSAGGFTFSTQDTDYLKVDAATGTITALAVTAEDATVTVTTYNDVSGDCTVKVVPAPTKVAFAKTSMTIGLKELTDLPPVILGVQTDDVQENCMAGYTFKTSNKKIVTVDAAGQIKGVATGSATITVTTHNKKTATVKVTVKKAPSKVTLSASRTTLGLNEEMPTTVAYPSGTYSDIRTYASNNEDILTVDEKGVVTAVGIGTATISVTTYNDKVGTLEFTVCPAPESIEPNDSYLVLGVGQSYVLGATLNEGSAGAFTFSTKDTDVLKVDAATGTITALAETAEDATVTVTTYNDVSGDCTVKVVPAPTKVAFAETSMTIGLKESAVLPAVILGVQTDDVQENCMASYTFKISNKKIVTVDADGNIYGVAAGSATITVTTHNKKTATVKITVKKAPTKVTLSASRTILGKGEKMPTSIAYPSGTYSLLRTYASDNEDILAVDEAGNVTAVDVGTANITVTTYNGKVGTLAFTVCPAPEGVEIDSLTLGAGETYTIAARLLPEESLGAITYSIDDPNVATIDPVTGAIKAVSWGVTTIRATTYNEHEATSTLTVKNAPTGISLQDSNFTLGVGDSYDLLPPVLTGEDVYSNTITYKSSATKYATVDANGHVKAVKEGKATITVSTYNSKKATVTVTVKAATKSIAFTEASHRLFIDHEFTPVVNFANSIPGSYTLESSDPEIAAIAEDGRTVIGISGGTVTITATSYNGKTATMEVYVPFLPDSIWLEPDALVMGEGDSDTLVARMPEGQGAELFFESESPSIVTYEAVDNETITLHALERGTAIVRVRAQNNVENTAQITVLSAPTAVSVKPRRAGRSIEEEQLQLTVGYGSADEGGRVIFTSSDPSIATVDSTGLVKFVGIGTVQIFVETYNGHKAVCDLTIGEQPGEMFFEQSEYRLALGDTIQLPASFDKGCESYTLYPDDASIATAEDDTVTGVALGTTTLRAVSRSGLEASCTVEVVPAPTGIELEVTEAALVKGSNSTMQLIATPLPDGVGSVYYTTSDPAVATVDYDTGMITAVEKGECVIYATTYNGHTAECHITVSYLLEGVKIGIDPGHQAKGNMAMESSSPKGGVMKYKVSYGTSGASTHIAEYKTNLTVGLKLRDALEALGAEVYMTRTTNDVNISNQQRAKMMNNYGVDLVLRLHCNSSSSSSTNGLNIYIRKSSAYANSVVNSNTLLSNESRAASAISAQFIKATGCKKGGIHKTNDYTMNNWSTVPCLLVEMGYMSNPAEDKNLNNAAYQAKMVKGMVNGICVYMGRDLPTEW